MPFYITYFPKTALKCLDCGSIILTSASDLHKLINCAKAEYISELEEALFCENKHKESQIVECEMQDKKWLEFEVTVTYSETDEPSEKIIRIRDVTKRKKQTEELKYMAYYDSLTGCTTGIILSGYSVNGFGKPRLKKQRSTCSASGWMISNGSMIPWE